MREATLPRNNIVGLTKTRFSPRRYLSQEYDDDINDKFGEIFELYDDIKLIGEEQKINIISSRQFSEDDLLRQHRFCFSDESYDPTAQQVLNNVKFQLEAYRKDGDLVELDAYFSEEDRLLERRAPPRYPEKSIKAVRYVAACPLCGGRVSATKGRLEFFGRIVGRCEEAPVEHAYSFDHVTRNGRLLR